jgi:serine/threonine protein kinase
VKATGPNLAKQDEAYLSPEEMTRHYQTETLGTVPWMAPEFLRDKTFEASGDIYSFSITLWEILTEKQPHSHLMPVQVLFQVINSVSLASLSC